MILPYQGAVPRLDHTVYVAPGAMIIGDVEMGAGSSAWFNTTIRGDVHHIRIGRATSVQDGSVLHVTRDTHPLHIGDHVTIGHGVILHGCTIGDRVLLGMGCIVLDGAEIGPETIIAAGTLIPERKKIPGGVLVMGSPGKTARTLTPEERAGLYRHAMNYVAYAEKYRASGGPDGR